MRMHLDGPFRGYWRHGYGLVYADPPWRQENWGAGNNRMPPYPTMTLAEMAALDVNSLCLRDTHLAMWTTHPHLAQSLALMKAWGFAYSTVLFTWVKLNKNGTAWRGMGKTTRKNTELVLLGRLGAPPRYDHNIDELIAWDGEPIDREIFSDRRQHSVKPEEARRRLDAYAGPEMRKIELFARRNDTGTETSWSHWGNQTDLYNGTPHD